MAVQLILGVVIGAAIGIIGTRFAIRRRGGQRRGTGLSDSVSSRSVLESASENSVSGASTFLSEVLDALTIGVVVASPEGGIVYRNAGATGLTRAVHSEVLVEEAVDNYVRAAVGGHGGRKILDLFGPPRQVISVTALPLANGGAVAMIEDTTERALTDAVRTDFVANISHELKTPIGAMAVLAETLTQQDDPDVVSRLSAKISDEAIRVGRLIDDLLALSRLEYGSHVPSETVSIPDIVHEAVERTQTLAETGGIEVTFAEREGEAVDSSDVIGDRRQLVSALQNLLENAIKYSEPTSSVEVEVRHDDEHVFIDVRDHGVGIPAKEMDRIFERFYRVDRARSRETGGTGLGLSIARHIATNHGGDILVESTEGRGSMFTLKLPLNTESRT